MTPGAGWTIVGQQGPDRFLIDIAETTPVAHGEPLALGRVLDRARRALFPAMPIGSIAARGYWEDFTGDQASLAGLLEGTEDIPAGPGHPITLSPS